LGGRARTGTRQLAGIWDTITQQPRNAALIGSFEMLNAANMCAGERNISADGRRTNMGVRFFLLMST
jgi:hypothetical protein